MKVVTSNIYPPSKEWCKNAYDADILVVQGYTYYKSYFYDDVNYFTTVRLTPDALVIKRITINKYYSIERIDGNLPIT